MPISYGVILRRALAAGAVAGMLVAGFYLVVARSTIEAAIAVEDAAGDHGHGALFSRGTQAVGGVIAGLVYGLLLGLVFGTVVAATRHRLPLRNDLQRVLLLAAAGFASTALVPALTYPAAPPGAGDAGDVGARTVQYLTLVVAGVVLAAGLVLLHERLRHRLASESALALTAVATVVGYTLLAVVWPDRADVVPADFPAALLWRFRVQSLASLALLWAVLGLGLGWSLARLDRPHRPLHQHAGAGTGT